MEKYQGKTVYNRKLFVLFVVLGVLTFLLMPCSHQPAHAEEVWSIKDGKLLVHSTTLLGSYPAPPKGISPETAKELITGERQDFVLEGKQDASLEIWQGYLPYPRITPYVPQSKISFSGGKWWQEKLLPKEIAKGNSVKLFEVLVFLTCFFFPAMSIVWFATKEVRASTRNTISALSAIFIYATIVGLIAITLGELRPTKTGIDLTILMVVAASGMAMGAVILYNRDSSIKIFAGCAVGMSSFIFSHGDFPRAKQYLLFVTSVLIFAFLCNRVAVRIERQKMLMTARTGNGGEYLVE